MGVAVRVSGYGDFWFWVVGFRVWGCGCVFRVLGSRVLRLRVPKTKSPCTLLIYWGSHPYHINFVLRSYNCEP